MMEQHRELRRQELHSPILVNEIVKIFSEKEGPKEKFLDATFGRGGHTKRILNEFPSIKVTAVDQDPDAIEYGKKVFSEFVQEQKLKFKKSNFASIDSLEDAPFDGILMDLGVSSPQLDTASRGFSLYNEGPLDMRMDPAQDLSASEIVNTWDERDLADLFFHYGEVRKSFRVARAIADYRKKKKFETTVELAEVIAKALGWKKKGHHPATECFQALRIRVNDELNVAKTGIEKLSQELRSHGLLFVITFHSLEDRLVKRLFLSMKELGRPLFKKVIMPSREEQDSNPRSRSAKLRVFERIVQ